MKTSIVNIGNSSPEPKKKIVFNEEYLLSFSALSDWNDPEEDKAWKYLQ